MLLPVFVDPHTSVIVCSTTAIQIKGTDSSVISVRHTSISVL